MSLSITVIIIIVNVIISLTAFQDQDAFYKLCLWPERVWNDKEWIRLLSGGFLHANFPHLFFNMFSLYMFGPIVEYQFSDIFGGAAHTMFIIFYIVAVVAANIPDLYEQRFNPSYRAVGASGAVSAVVFASILFSPTSKIGIFPIPFMIPAYMFGIIYLIYSAYMSRLRMDNIGHLAHFSGAVFGIIFPLIFQPSLFMDFIQKITSR